MRKWEREEVVNYYPVIIKEKCGQRDESHVKVIYLFFIVSFTTQVIEINGIVK